MGVSLITLGVPEILGEGALTLAQYIDTLSPEFWLQADQGDIALLADSADVNTWDDQGSAGLDVTEATNPPTYKTGQLNSTLPIVRFDGSATLLTNSSVTGSALFSNDRGTIVFVIKQDSTQANNAVIAWTPGSTNNTIKGLCSFGDVLYYDHARGGSSEARLTVAQPAGWDDAWHVVELNRDAADLMDITVDGVLLNSKTATLDADTSQSADLTIGNTTTIYFKGDIYAIMAWKTPLATGVRSTLRNMIGDATGITITNHDVVVSSPENYQTFQRDGSDQADIAISGYINENGPVSIEARFNGGSWATIDTGVTRLFSGTLSAQDADQGDLDVRIVGQGYTATVTPTAINDAFLLAGQSNAVGVSGTNTTNSTPPTPVKFGNDYVWQEATNPIDDDTDQVDSVSADVAADGSIWPLVIDAYMTDQGLPMTVIPCAKGSSSITDWLPGADHQDRSTLYGSMVYRALQAGGVKAVLWWQGETDAANGMAEATYNGHLDTIANAIQSDLGVKLVCCVLQQLDTGYALQADQDAIRAAQNAAIGDNANVLQGPDLSDTEPAGDGVHFNQSADQTLAANRWWSALQTLYYS